MYLAFFINKTSTIQIKFSTIFWMQNIFHFFPRKWQYQVIKIKISFVAESNNNYTFAMLRYEMLRINNPPLSMIFKFIDENIQNDLKSVSFVMTFQVFDIFQHECHRSLGSNNL